MAGIGFGGRIVSGVIREVGCVLSCSSRLAPRSSLFAS